MTQDEPPRLQTFLWLEPQLRAVESAGGSYYILQRGAPAAGTVLAKWRHRNGLCEVYQQERNSRGVLGWRRGAQKAVDEAGLDAYIQRAVQRDPDIWVVELESVTDVFPLEGPIFHDVE